METYTRAYVEGLSVFMALVDFIPVILFFIATLSLQRYFYSKMVKGAFAVFAAGTVMVFSAGLLKALWKILYALEVCDFVILDKSFWVLQALGFILLFASTLGYVTGPGEAKAVSLAIVPVVYMKNTLFIILQTLGCAGFLILLAVIAKRLKKRLAIILFAFSLCCMLGMGYLSAKFDDSSSMNWLAQGVNTIGQCSLLMGVLEIQKQTGKVSASR